MDLKEALLKAAYISIDAEEGEAPWRVIGVDDEAFNDPSFDCCLYVEVEDEELNSHGEEYQFFWYELLAAEKIEIFTLTPLEFTR